MIQENSKYIWVYGVCSGCGDPVVHTRSKRSDYEAFDHYLWDSPEKRNPNCKYADPYGRIPEWAFFPYELIGKSEKPEED